MIVERSQHAVTDRPSSELHHAALRRVLDLLPAPELEGDARDGRKSELEGLELLVAHRGDIRGVERVAAAVGACGGQGPGVAQTTVGPVAVAGFKYWIFLSIAFIK